jgi:hypothetical protein
MSILNLVCILEPRVTKFSTRVPNVIRGLVALWPTHNTTSHVRVRPFRLHQRPPHQGRSRAEHASASRPSQQPIRPSRARAPAELQSAASNTLKVGSLPAEDRHVAHVARPRHHSLHEPLHLRPKAPRTSNVRLGFPLCFLIRHTSVAATLFARIKLNYIYGLGRRSY